MGEEGMNRSTITLNTPFPSLSLSLALSNCSTVLVVWYYEIEAI